MATHTVNVCFASMICGSLVACAGSADVPSQEQEAPGDEMQPGVVDSTADGEGTNPQASDADGYVLAVRVHLLRSDVEALNSTMSEAEAERRVAEASKIWAQSGIEWTLESVVVEQALNAENFRPIVRGDPMSGPILGMTLPRDQMLEPGWNVFVAHDVGILGVYGCGRQVVLISEHNPQTGAPTDDVLLAHELGHSLQLDHTTCDRMSNLMFSGGDCQTPTPPGNELDEEQIAIARAQANMNEPALCR